MPAKKRRIQNSSRGYKLEAGRLFEALRFLRIGVSVGDMADALQVNRRTIHRTIIAIRTLGFKLRRCEEERKIIWLVDNVDETLRELSFSSGNDDRQ